MRLRAGRFEFQFPRPCLVMGIVNVTPDSFSDGGQYFDPEKALARAEQLVAEGADIIDIGGESTRPRSTPVSLPEELRRVLPVIEALALKVDVPISVDTQKPEVARAALRAGASIVNDVGANRADKEMWNIVAEASAGYVAMHMRGIPETMQSNPTYENVVGEVDDFFEERLMRLQTAGVDSEQVMLDVGIGFGKTVGHNLDLLAHLGRFARHGRPMVLGVSRKSFLGKVIAAEAGDRLPGALACACLAAEAGVQIIRTHDVAPTVSALRTVEAIRNRRC